MPKQVPAVVAAFAAFVATWAAACALALLSVHIERSGPELEAYGNLCGPTSDQPCLEPALKGGFPLAFLVDAGGLSVEHKLSLFEDRLHRDALAIDVALYFVALLGVRLIRRLCRGTPLMTSIRGRRADAELPG